MPELIDKDGLYITEKHVFFFKNKCPFSNFYPAKFVSSHSDGTYAAILTEFKWSEQFFMWKKAMAFNDQDVADQILKAKSPKECKELGRKVSNYNDMMWNAMRFSTMVEANYYKFTQNRNLKDFLLDSRFDGKTFVEASPHDAIWGIQMGIGDPGIDDELNWKGQNLQGKVIDKVRILILDSGDRN